MSKHDSELREVSGQDFVMRLTDVEKYRWLEIADDQRVADALRVCVAHQLHDTKRQIVEAQTRRSVKAADIEAERRHRESLTVDRSARNIGWIALVVSVLSLVIGAYAVSRDSGEGLKQQTSRLPSNSASGHLSEPTPLSPAVSAGMDDASPVPAPTSPTEPPPLPEPKPDTQPTPKE
jgi:hypothetical protein